MNRSAYRLQAKAEAVLSTRPRSALATRTSRADRGLIGSAGVAFLNG
jgi:hypothetical protein